MLRQNHASGSDLSSQAGVERLQLHRFSVSGEAGMGKRGAVQSASPPSFIIFFAVGFFFYFSLLAAAAIPVRYDGFTYGVGSLVADSIVVEAFFDPICPDSRDAWPPLKRIIHEYSPRIFLLVHAFPLPYHDNSFFSCRALHISDRLNKSSTYPLLELFFKQQEKLYNAPTRTLSRESVIKQIIELTTEATLDSAAIEYGFEDSETDLAARTSFKYGCSRGVTGTPFFFVNGFPLPGAGSALDYEQWEDIIKPLLRKSLEEEEGAPLSWM